MRRALFLLAGPVVLLAAAACSPAAAVPAAGAALPPEQVTVSGSTSLDADVAAKAGFLLGETGPALLDERGMPGRFVRDDGTVVVNATWRAATADVGTVRVACT